MTTVSSEPLEKERHSRPTDQALRIDRELEVKNADIASSALGSAACVDEAFSVVDNRERDSSRSGASPKRFPRGGDRALALRGPGSG